MVQIFPHEFQAERAEVITATAELAEGRVPVLALPGDTATRLVVSRAVSALESGADAVSIVHPYYVDYSQNELKNHYRTVCREIGQPVFVSQIPQMTRVSFAIPSLIELAGEETVNGIKDSAGIIDFTPDWCGKCAGMPSNCAAFTAPVLWRKSALLLAGTESCAGSPTWCSPV